jgi:hypothetical protein
MASVGRARYRIQQGLRVLGSRWQPVDDATVEGLLPPPLLALFRGMSRSDQLHSVHVLYALRETGEVPLPLAQAALLHDVGKSRYPVRLWQRTLPVLVQIVAARRVHTWAGGDPNKLWVRPFAVYVQHPAWGAAMVEKAGGHPDAVWLIAHHADPLERWAAHPLAGWLARLRQADDTH